MALPAQAISTDNIKLRDSEPYTSEALNRKFVGYPPGIFRGFVPTVDVGGNLLYLNPDPTANDHIGAGETIDPLLGTPTDYQLHVRMTGIITLDFTGVPAANCPAYVVLSLAYTPPPSGSTSGLLQAIQIKTPAQINAGVPAEGDNWGIESPVGSATINPGAFAVNHGDVVLFRNAAWHLVTTQKLKICRVNRATDSSPIVVNVPPPTIANPGDPLSGSNTVPPTNSTTPGSDVFVPTHRQTPVAYQGVSLGFMPGGSIERLNFSFTEGQEVITARTSNAALQPPDGLGFGGTVAIQNFTGTVAPQNGNAAVVGTGTAFMTQLVVGQVIQFASQPGTPYTVQLIGSNTSITLASVYTGTTSAATTLLGSLVGTDTAFTAALTIGQTIQLASQLGTPYSIIAITDNTHLTLAATYTGPTALVTTIVPIWPTLESRLDHELSGAGADGMAARLARVGMPVEGSRMVALASIGWPFNGTDFTRANVSNDFRHVPPGGGAPLPGGLITKGAITSTVAPTGSPDLAQNYCFVMDDDYNDFANPTLDDSANVDLGATLTNGLVYGRLTCPPSTAVPANGVIFMDGTHTFSLVGAVYTVTLTGGTFGGYQAFVPGGGDQYVVEGDIVVGPDGNFYTVSVVPDNTHLNLSAVQIPAPPIAGAVTGGLFERRRFTLSFKTFSGGAEHTKALNALTNLTPPIVLRYFFHQVFDAADRPPFGEAFMLRRGRRVPSIPLASATVPGAVVLAPNGGVTPGTAVQANDSRLGAASAAGVAPGGSGGPVGPRQVLQFAGNNCTVVVSDPGGNAALITITVAAAGASFPGFGGSGSASTCSHSDHTHGAGPSAPDLQIDLKSFPNSTANFSVGPFAVANILGIVWGTLSSNNVLCVGAAVGTSSGQQYCVQIAGGGGVHDGAGKFYTDTFGNDWSVSTFGPNSIGLTKNSGNVGGGFILAIGHS